MNLCIDIGNSQIKLGIFKGRFLIEKQIIGKNKTALIKDLILNRDIQNSILSTTEKKNPSLWKILSDHTKFIFLNKDTAIPFKIKYETLETLGSDRIAAVAGAYIPKPLKSHLIIDAGTCITYDFINNKGEYLGGNISPGIQMRLKAMHEFTSGLPLVKKELPDQIVGKSTEMALQNGAILGTIMEIESFIKRINNKHPRININLTGGDALFLSDKLKTKIFVSPNLVLTGLNEILLYNVE